MFWVVLTVGRFGHESFRLWFVSEGLGSFRPWVISDTSHLDHGLFQLGGLGRFDLIFGWVVSAYFGGLFRLDTPMPPPIPSILQYNQDAHYDTFYNVLY